MAGGSAGRFGIKLPVLTAMVVVGSLFGLQGVSNAAKPPKKVATVNVNPTSVSANGSVTGATIFVRNDTPASGTADIGIGSWDADLSLFTAVSNYSITNSSRPGWTLTLAGGHLKASTTGSNKLLSGESMTVTLDLTAGCTLGTGGILVYNAVDWTSDTYGLSGNSSISVVAGAATPTKLKVTAVTVPPPGGTGVPVAAPVLGIGTGTYLISAGGSFNVTVEVENSAGQATNPCSNITVSLLRKVGTGSLGGTTTGTITTAQTSTTISGVTYSPSGTGVQIQADDDTTITESTETGLLPDVFTADFLSGLVFQEDPLFTQAGGPTTTTSLSSSSSTGTCDADSTHPTCVTISTPLGTGGSGTYATAALLPCTALSTTCKGLGLAFIASNKAALLALYDNATPNAFMTLTIQCDRTACPGGGVSNYTVDISTANGTPATPSLPCTSSVKDFVDPPGQGNLGFCTDYSASKRTGSQDLILVVRLAVDYTGRIH